MIFNPISITMNLMHNDNPQIEIRNKVRRNAGSAAIAAVLMLYFGFKYLQEPTGTDLFSWAAWIFFHTLRIGGITMAILAAWSLIGQPIVMAVDAFVSIIIGVIFMLTGIAMFMDGGGMFQPLLNVVFGWTFISAGRNNWSTYSYIQSTLNKNENPLTPLYQSRTTTFINHTHVSSNSATDLTQNIEPSDQDTGTLDDHPDDQPPIETAPDGYLASFANEEQPPRNES